MGLEGCISSTGKKIVILKKKERKDGEIKNCVILDSDAQNGRELYSFLNQKLDYIYKFGLCEEDLQNSRVREEVYKYIQAKDTDAIILNAESTSNLKYFLKEIKTELTMVPPIILLSNASALIANKYFTQRTKSGVVFMLKLPNNIQSSVNTFKSNLISVMIDTYDREFPEKLSEFYLPC